MVLVNQNFANIANITCFKSDSVSIYVHVLSPEMILYSWQDTNILLLTFMFWVVIWW